MLKNNKGITLTALVITIIIMIILIAVGIHIGTDAVKKAELEDIKTDMISIKTRAKIIPDKYNYEEDYEGRMGQLVEDQTILNKLGVTGDLYKWDRATLDEQGLSNIKEDVYYVQYDFENPSNTEVYYIKGFKGKYSLADIGQITDVNSTTLTVKAEDRWNS